MALNKTYFLRHLQVLFSTLGQLVRMPAASLMMAAVIGVALALPTGLYVLLDQMQRLSTPWQSAVQISLFLTDEASQPGRYRQVLKEVEAFEEVDHVELITPEQAFDEFRELSGFGAALDALNDNPLPAVIVVQPVEAITETESAERLQKRLQAVNGVEIAQLDLAWMKRVYALIELGQRGVMVLAVLFGLAVFLIVGNTIRLAIQNRRQEIEVMKLVGATDAFIRRPFLYSGFWYGVFGAVFAWFLVNFAMLAIAQPIQRFAVLYDSQFTIQMIGFSATLGLLFFAIALGLTGSMLALRRHLREIEPN